MVCDGISQHDIGEKVDISGIAKANTCYPGKDDRPAQQLAPMSCLSMNRASDTDCNNS